MNILYQNISLAEAIDTIFAPLIKFKELKVIRNPGYRPFPPH